MPNWLRFWASCRSARPGWRLSTPAGADVRQDRADLDEAQVETIATTLKAQASTA